MLHQQFVEDLIGIAQSKNVKLNEPMKTHTSFKVGGPADMLVTPVTSDALGKVLRLCNNENVPVLIMGNGSNLLVGDEGIRGVVIKLTDDFRRFNVSGETIEAEAGILLSNLSNIALENELSGLEFASGIPGTLGGAIAMNAGAYGGEMSQVIIKTNYMDMAGNVHEVEGASHLFGYRTSFVKQSTESLIVISAVLNLKKSDRQSIKNLIDDLAAKRKSKQPLNKPSAGSTFKRPEGHFAGKLIAEAGLRGYELGGAKVSDLHCGFIVNAGNATAKDILNLIALVQDKVKQNSGIILEPEVQIVGEF